ncbi:eukaryotic translation initiation factor 5 [Hyalella azteca]|uniref:Eukaryotic translation initiation factor 5 n=1 Tax=Hyalella azteca TaxID=294128 RepID=A0A8B7P638_HYAAZ|nr:eukaryotic translation initiation factor 5 [Hyalella azteca]XP_018021524.1 eukaryotic translation initiation factor 5 [Hyalella azteca]
MSYNVNRSVTDAFYRYKMPKLMAKVEGKGNGIKTVIVNMVDVAKAVGCPPTYPCKFFGCELGAQTFFDFKNDRYIVNGSHDATKLQQLLDVFIKKFVLCPSCDNPETTLFPNEKKGIIKQTCKACGHQCQLDMRHKLTTFILKNPPDVKPDQLGNSKTQKKTRTKNLQPDSPNGGTNSASDDQKSDDDDWAMQSDVAASERMRDLSANVKRLTVSTHADRSQSERLELFYDYCKGKKNKGILVPGADVAVYKDIAAEADTLEVRENKGVMVLIELLFDENCVKQLTQYRILLLLFTHGNDKSQKYLLGALEKLVEMKKEALLPKVPHILKTLYDHDIVDEEVIVEWSKKASKKYVSKEMAQEIHKKAAPFLKWLQEAEEEDSSEEEDESDEDDLRIEYDDKALSMTLKEQEAKAAGPKKPAVAEIAPTQAAKDAEDDGSDIDIDDL